MATLGLSSEEVGTLSGVAKLTGTTMEGLSTSIERMSLNVQKSTKDAFNPAAQGLKVLGLNAKELIGLPTEQYFLKLADAVSKFNPSLNLTNAVMAAGGHGVAQMLPLLLQGSEHITDLSAAVKETGMVLTDAETKSFAETHEKLTLMGMSLEGVGKRIFEIFEPAINQAADAIRKFAQGIDDGKIRTAVESIAGFMIDLARDIAKWFVEAKEQYDLFVAGIGNGGDKLKKAIGDSIKEGAADAGNNFLAAMSDVGRLATKVVIGPNTAATLFGSPAENKATADAAKTSFDEIAAGAEAANKRIDAAAADWHAKVTASLAGLGAGGTAGPPAPKLNAGAIDTGGKDAITGQITAYQNQIKLADDAYKATAEKLGSEVKTFQVSKDEETQALLAALQKRHDAENAAIDGELLLYARGTAGYNKALAERDQLNAKFWADEQKVRDQALEADTKAWESALKPIQSAWDSQIKGLLAGTETFAQAMKNIFTDLSLTIIKKLEDVAVQKLASSLATAFGDPAAMLAGATRSIMSDMGVMYAGEAAFFAPTLGPAAPAAAAGVVGAAQATALGMAALDTGAWSIPHEGMAVLHPGETVLPAGAANTFRSMAEGGAPGGGASVAPVFQIHAMDAASIQAFFQKNGQQIARVLSAHLNQPSFNQA